MCSGLMWVTCICLWEFPPWILVVRAVLEGILDCFLFLILYPSGCCGWARCWLWLLGICSYLLFLVYDCVAWCLVRFLWSWCTCVSFFWYWVTLCCHLPTFGCSRLFVGCCREFCWILFRTLVGHLRIFGDLWFLVGSCWCLLWRGEIVLFRGHCLVSLLQRFSTLKRCTFTLTLCFLSNRYSAIHVMIHFECNIWYIALKMDIVTKFKIYQL